MRIHYDFVTLHKNEISFRDQRHIAALYHYDHGLPRDVQVTDHLSGPFMPAAERCFFKIDGSFSLDRLRAVRRDHSPAVLVAVFDGQLNRVLFDELAVVFRRQPLRPQLFLGGFLHRFEAPFPVAGIAVVQEFAEFIGIALLTAHFGDPVAGLCLKSRIPFNETQRSAEIVKDRIKLFFHIVPLSFQRREDIQQL